MEANNSFQSSWTLAESLIFDIAGHLKAGRRYWLVGNMERYYWEMETIGRILYGMLTDDEKKEARIKEAKILNLFPVKDNNKQELYSLLKDYDGMIMTFLHTHKLDVPPKRDRTVMIA